MKKIITALLLFGTLSIPVSASSSSEECFDDLPDLISVSSSSEECLKNNSSTTKLEPAFRERISFFDFHFDLLRDNISLRTGIIKYSDDRYPLKHFSYELEISASLQGFSQGEQYCLEAAVMTCGTNFFKSIPEDTHTLMSNETFIKATENLEVFLDKSLSGALQVFAELAMYKRTKDILLDFSKYTEVHLISYKVELSPLSES